MQKNTRNKVVAGIAVGIALSIAVPAAIATLYQPGFFSNLFASKSNELTVVTHDSVAFPKELLADFKKETGITVKQLKAGDAGAMLNKLVLTKDSPIGDMVYGIDNTFLSTADAADIAEPAGEGYDKEKFVEIDFADVCLNYDKEWFAKNESAPPTSMADLTKPEYKGLTVLTNPTTSSPGLAFLATTVTVFGESGWQQYWQALKANDVKIDAGWEDAYFTDFSGSSGKGAYPIVLSYSSSPAFEIRDNGESQTASLLNECFRQFEFAAILKNGKNTVGANKFIAFMLEKKFQASLPDANYVYPVRSDVKLPKTWAEFAPAAIKTIGNESIAAKRKSWFAAWSDIFAIN